MLARNETIFKWALYTAATLLCFLVQGLILQRFTLWGVIPFLYPVLPAVVATYEGPVAGAIYGIAVGVACDSLLPGPIPCFYTLVFPLLGLCGALISQSLLPAGFLCSLVVSAIGFLMTDVFHCFLLWAAGRSVWSTGLFLMLREFCVTAVWTLPVTLLFSAVFRRTRFDD